MAHATTSQTPGAAPSAAGPSVKTVELRPESPLAQGPWVVPRGTAVAVGVGLLVLGVLLVWWRFRVRRKSALGRRP
jgi:hypothetical protein